MNWRLTRRIFVVSAFWACIFGAFLVTITTCVFLNVVWAIIALGGYILLLETSFRLLYRLVRHKQYQLIPKIPFKEFYIEPHPYMPYVYKVNFLTQKPMQAPYVLNKEMNYQILQLRSNNYRYMNGPKGNRDIIVPKPHGLNRINCYGASTTGNYIGYQDEAFSYPIILEKILRQRFPDLNIEVNNCGAGGRTTAEILIDFALNGIDMQPDIVVIYHAYNDIQTYLTPGFRSDYSHAKRNLGEAWSTYRRADKIPYIPLAFFNFLINKIMGQNIRYSLLRSVAKGEVDYHAEFKGIETYKRNIENLINLCKANGIQVVLSTFCHYLYDEIQDNEVHLKYRAGVMLENQMMAELAQKHVLPLADNFKTFCYEDRYFVDSIHFSHLGMIRLAENISEPIMTWLEGRRSAK